MTSIKVLLIEDDEEDAFFLRGMLRSSNGNNVSYEIEQVKCFAKGIERLEKISADILLLDLTLPDSELFETFFKIKELSQKIPIIVLTGLADEQVARRAVQEGADNYLIKGEFQSDLLKHSISNAIGKRRVK